jgi:hypothetical protein
MPADSYSRTTLLETAMNSPRAVATHDRSAWMSLFAECHVVEDPVGSRPHIGGVFDKENNERGRGALGRFFDTFIAPNDIVFLVDRDIVCDRHVVRDLTIEIRMAPTVIVQVPMHLLYELVEENGRLKIQRLAAHWELGTMLKQVARPSLAHLRVNNQLGLRMLKLQGLGGVGGFMRALSSVGEAGKKTVRRFAECLEQQDKSGLSSLLSTDARLEFPYGSDPTSLDLLLAAGQQLTLTKMLAAGDAVTASFLLNNQHRGVAFFYFNRRTMKIHRAIFYWDE